MTGGKALLIAALLATVAPAAAQAQLPTPLPGVGSQPPGPPQPGQQPQRPPERPAPPGGPVTGAGEVGAYRGNAARTGVTPDDAVFGPLTQQWSVRLGQASSPLLVAGKVIANIAAGSDENASRVVALDAATGREVWRRDVPGTYFTAHLASDRERVFAINQDGVVRAFAVADGTLLWEVGPLGRSATVDGPPVVSEGLVVTIAGGAVWALRAADGREAWRKPLRREGDYEIDDIDAEVPVVAERRVFAADDCGNVLALDLGSGEELWRATRSQACQELFGGGVVADGRLYAGRAVYDAASGARVAQLDLGRQPAIAGGVAFAQYPPRAVRVDGGAEAWRYVPPGEPSGYGESLPPLLVGETVYVLAHGRTLVGLDRSTGRPLSSLKLTYEEQSDRGGRISGIAAGQGVMVATLGPTLTAFTGVLRPARAGTDAAATALAVVTGQTTDLVGGVGPALPGAQVELQADRFPYDDRWERVAAATVQSDRTFYANDVALTRNTRFRLAAAGATEALRPLEITAAPRFASKVRRLRRNRIEVRGAVSGPPDMPAARRRFVVYLGRVHHDRAQRLGSAVLRRTGRGRAAASVRFRALKRVGADDVLMFCVRGLAARGFGRVDAFERNCGRRHIRVDLEPPPDEDE
jgi:outer membrane protein assembly factor BamB